MNSDNFYTTSALAKLLGISRVAVFKKIKSGRIKAQKIGRNFVIFKQDIGELETLVSELYTTAQSWVLTGSTFSDQWYCPHSDTFQARLVKMQGLMQQDLHAKTLFSLLTSIAREIGNNSYDHNLGNWPDTPGIFFGYDVVKRHIVLADRGLGILKTLQRVRPQLNNDQEALRVAFTEIVSGRAPEARGNGLKYVRNIIAKYPIKLLFRTGNAQVTLLRESKALQFATTQEYVQGCIAFITY